MKIYESLEEIEKDLRIYDLQRKIAEEEAKASGLSLQQNWIPGDFLRAGLKIASRWGLAWFFKKVMR